MPDYEATLSTPIQLGDALDALACYGYYFVWGHGFFLFRFGHLQGDQDSLLIYTLFVIPPGGLHPDHDTIANFRATFLVELEDLFV